MARKKEKPTIKQSAVRFSMKWLLVPIVCALAACIINHAYMYEGYMRMIDLLDQIPMVGTSVAQSFDSSLVGVVAAFFALLAVKFLRSVATIEKA